MSGAINRSRVTGAVLGIAAAFAAVQLIAPRSGALYQESLKPRPDSPFVTEEDIESKGWREAIEDATAEALVVFKPTQNMVVGESSTVRVVVTLDLDVEPTAIIEDAVGNRITVGLTTEARLSDDSCVTDCAFIVSPGDFQSRTFASDSNEIEWTWQVTPQRCGDFDLVLETRPVLRDGTTIYEQLDIEITRHRIGVRAYPDQETLEAWLMPDRLSLDVADTAREGTTTTPAVTIESVDGDAAPPELVATLVALDDNVLVTPSTQIPWDPDAPSPWTIEALEPGAARLELKVAGARSVPDGCMPIEAVQSASLLVEAEPEAGPSGGEQAGEAFNWLLTVGIGAAVGVAGLIWTVTQIRNNRAKQQPAVAAAAGAGGPPPPDSDDSGAADGEGDDP